MRIGYCSNSIYETDAKFCWSLSASNSILMQQGEKKKALIPMGSMNFCIKYESLKLIGSTNNEADIAKRVPLEKLDNELFSPRLLIVEPEIVSMIDCEQVEDSEYYVYSDKKLHAAIHTSDEITKAVIMPAILVVPREFTLKDPKNSLSRYLETHHLL